MAFRFSEWILLIFFTLRRRQFVAAVLLASVVGIFVFVKPAQAFWPALLLIGGTGLLAWLGIGAAADKLKDLPKIMGAFLIALMIGIIDWLKDIFLWVVGMMTKIAAYNDFLDAQAVQTGWVIVRDIGNMFFVIILLVIAIATILRVEAYSYKKLLPKLLLMAVLINFSKTICGIIIDFAQVLMLTFVNAFKAAAGANFIQAFGMQDIWSIKAQKLEEMTGQQQVDFLKIVLFAFVLVMVAFVTVLVLLIVLLVRIVALWTLIILSPLAFLLASFPQGQKYASQWWEQFTKYVIVGPVLAFFIWLSLVVAGGGRANEQVGATFGPNELSLSVSQAADPNNLSSFIVGVTMLLIGLMFTQQLGVAGSGVAGSALSGLRRAGTAPLRAARKGVSWGWGKTKAGVKGGYNRAADITYATTGLSLPLSERRRSAKEAREKAIRTQREATGMAKTAERMAGGRALWASVLDPRAAKTMTRYEMAKATLGVKDAKDKVQRAGESLAGAAATEMRSVDPLQAEKLKHKTEAAMGEKQAKPQIMERYALQQMEATYESGLRDQDAKVAKTREENVGRRTMLTAEKEGINQMLGLSNEDLIADMAGKRFIKERDAATKRGESLPAGRLEDLRTEERGKVYREAMERAGKGASQENLDREINNVLREPLQGRLAEIDKEESGVTRGEEKTRQERDNLASVLERVRGELSQVSQRLENPREAKKDAIARRTAALGRGDTAEVKKIDVEIRKIDQALGMAKVQDAQKFFAKSYNEQLAQAKDSAKGASEESFVKELIVAHKDGKITDDDRKEIIKKLAENLKDAKALLEEKTKPPTPPATTPPAP